jgi:hypothetical protein
MAAECGDTVRVSFWGADWTEQPPNVVLVAFDKSVCLRSLRRLGKYRRTYDEELEDDKKVGDDEEFSLMATRTLTFLSDEVEEDVFVDELFMLFGELLSIGASLLVLGVPFQLISSSSCT